MKTVIVGSGAGGLTTASTLRKYSEDMEIVVITGEKYIAYSPCAIPYVIGGEIPSFQDIVMHTPEDYRKNRNIEIITESTVVDVDSKNKNVIYYGKDGNRETLRYDYLVIATGGKTFIPSVEGKDLTGVFKVKTIEDGMRIKDYTERSKSAVVVGAGAIGLEIAYALKRLDLNVTVVEIALQVLPRALDIDMAEIVLKYLKDLGIEIILGKPISKILGDGNRVVKGVVVGDRFYSCDMVVMATGIKPNIELAKRAGCKIGRLGINVNSRMETSVPNIYAVGDCVETVDFITKQAILSPFGSTAVRQGKVAGKNIAGIPAEFKPVLNAMVSKIGDLEIGSTGISELRAHQNRLEVVVGKVKTLTRARYYPGGKPIYVKLIFDMNKTLIGCQIVGGERVSERIDAMSLGILKGITCEELINMEFSYAPPVSMVVDPITLAAEDAWDKFRRLE